MGRDLAWDGGDSPVPRGDSLALAPYSTWGKASPHSHRSEGTALPMLMCHHQAWGLGTRLSPALAPLGLQQQMLQENECDMAGKGKIKLENQQEQLPGHSEPPAVPSSTRKARAATLFAVSSAASSALSINSFITKFPVRD